MGQRWPALNITFGCRLQHFDLRSPPNVQLERQQNFESIKLQLGPGWGPARPPSSTAKMLSRWRHAQRWHNIVGHKMAEGFVGCCSKMGIARGKTSNNSGVGRCSQPGVKGRGGVHSGVRPVGVGGGKGHAYIAA